MLCFSAAGDINGALGVGFFPSYSLPIVPGPQDCDLSPSRRGGQCWVKRVAWEWEGSDREWNLRPLGACDDAPTN